MAVILFTNLKGGVAKTTNAVAVAECLASQGKPTLLIDADHQCTAGESLLGETRQMKLDTQKKTLHDLLAEMLKPEFETSQFAPFVQNGVSNIGGGLEALSAIPSSVRIDDFQTNYAKGGHGFKEWKEFRRMFDGHRKQLRRWLQQNFAFTIIDCPPSLALQVKLLLGVSDGYVIPCQPNRFSIRGAEALVHRIQSAGYRRDCLGLLWSMVRGQDATHGEIIQGFKNKQVTPFQSTVPLAASISNATAQFVPPEGKSNPNKFRGKYGAKFGRIYESFCEELIERLPSESICNVEETVPKKTRAGRRTGERNRLGVQQD